MKNRQSLPKLWLLSDARNDAVLEQALCRLPRGSGFVFRHHHLNENERRARFTALARIARARGHVVVLAGSAALARRWGADGAYGAARRIAAGAAALRLITAHSLRELRGAGRADAVLLSPVFPTRSHPGGKAMGPLRFRLIAARSPAPAIALGGMNTRSERRLAYPRWAAIDGLSATKRLTAKSRSS